MKTWRLVPLTCLVFSSFSSKFKWSWIHSWMSSAEILVLFYKQKNSSYSVTLLLSTPIIRSFTLPSKQTQDGRQWAHWAEVVCCSCAPHRLHSVRRDKGTSRKCPSLVVWSPVHSRWLYWLPYNLSWCTSDIWNFNSIFSIPCDIVTIKKCIFINMLNYILL